MALMAISTDMGRAVLAGQLQRKRLHYERAHRSIHLMWTVATNNVGSESIISNVEHDDGCIAFDRRF